VIEIEPADNAHDIAVKLHRELFKLELAARSRTLALDIDTLEVQFGLMLRASTELCERLKPEDYLSDEGSGAPDVGII
jgi:hypothetical protein